MPGAGVAKLVIRDGFKIHCPFGRVGSSPTSGMWTDTRAASVSLRTFGTRLRAPSTRTCSPSTSETGTSLGTRGHFASRSHSTPRIQESSANASGPVAALTPRNPVRVLSYHGASFVDVACYSSLWPDLIPQIGPGPKHRRRIVLERWQEAVVEAEPRSFIRGLFHSDGSYFRNSVRSSTGKLYSYVRYMFANHSRDIRELFRWACSLVGVETQMARWRNVSVGRRESVGKLNEFLGPKT